jgi:hypothetical protein
MGETKRRRQRLMRLFKQDCRCYWCRRPTELVVLEKHRNDYPDNMATIDHLNSRLSEHRGKLTGPQTVLSCYRCNHTRGRLEVAITPKEELWRRCGSFPLNHPQYRPKPARAKIRRLSGTRIWTVCMWDHATMQLLVFLTGVEDRKLAHEIADAYEQFVRKNLE